MRVAIVYDCLYPYTVGGAERWLSLLARDLSRDHEVTYVTRRQWPPGERDPLPGVSCVAVAPGGELYAPSGRRRMGPPLRFGLGVLAHFLRRRRSYDVVHCVSFPFFALLAVRAATAGPRRPRLVAEWLEWWSPAYWRRYVGPAAGTVGRMVQRLALAASPAAVVFSDLNVERLRAAGHRGELVKLPGLFDGEPAAPEQAAWPPRAVFAGRQIPEKRVAVVPAAVAEARNTLPELVATIFGDGPERARVIERVRELDLEDVVDVPGFVEAERLDAELRSAACLVAPSVREGHGMAVVEAAAVGVPVVVCRHPDNAATELVEDGVNGFVARDGSPEALGEAIARVVDAGAALRESTAAWFTANAAHLSAPASVARLRELYRGGRR